MRKSIVATLCLLLILVLAVSVSADNFKMTVQANESTIHPGDKVTVTVSVDTFANCKSGSLLVSFNENIFSCSDEKWLPDGLAVNTPELPAVFAFSNPKDISGKIYQFTLTAKEAATLGNYDVSVTLTLKDADGNPTTVLQSVTIKLECDHKYDTGEVTKEATCNEEGTRIRTCTRCGEKRTDKIAKLGHQYDAGQVEEPPTCTKEGKLVYTCTRCRTTKSEKIDPTGHAYDDDCDSECNNCGESRTVEHNYGDYWTSDASGHWHGCIDCGHVLELFPHNPGPEATETTEQICLDCHYVLQPCKPHEHTAVGDWLGDEEHHWNKCACGENFDEGDHQWNEGDVNESTGEVTYLCTVCGYSKTVAQETVPPTQPEDVGTEPTRPGQQGGEEKEANPWIVVSLILAILLAASWIYIILGIVGGKKRGGKFSS